jgi:antitoxin component YwqK of YwqJK toxin-antitoxin module
MKFNDQPFTGVVKRDYPDGSRQKLREVTYKDGKWHGLATLWYKNG